MAEKTEAVVVGVLILVLVGLIAADLYISQQIETILRTEPADRILFNEIWMQMQKERLSTILFSTVVFLILLAIVLKIGAKKRNERRISQKEAQEIVRKIMADYKEKGILVTAKGENDERKRSGGA